MPLDPENLKSVRDAAGLLALLKSAPLNWPVEGKPLLDFYDESELARSLVVRPRIRSLVPEGTADEWLILLVEFPDRFYQRDLGTLLANVKQDRKVTERFLGREKTLFIVTRAGEDGLYENIQFVHFAARAGRTPEIKRIEWTHTFVGRTVWEINLPALRWSNKGNWESAWDVEGLTEKFYNEFERVFYDFKATIQWNAGVDDDTHQAITQLWFNRLLLLAFVEKREWLETPDGQHGYLRAMWDRHGATGNYVAADLTEGQVPADFKALLSRLFTLLDTEPHRREEGPGKIPFYGTVPYLNGGLFHQDAIENHRFTITDSAFEPILGKDGLFARFNFTVTESSPADQTVAVDPEMLGRVFERLVNDRHQEGKYYTPRPIVAFMVDEALKGYLVEQGVAPEKASLLVDEEKLHDEATGVSLRGDELSRVRELVTSVRVVDPACGSGAYLLGLLQKLFMLGYVLEWRAQAKNLLPKQRGEFLYRMKLELVQRCIYGVDLDPTAVGIARLRLWLSLAIENVAGETPRPLPYLDFKIAQGDSLIYPLSGGVQKTMETEMFRQFDQARADAEDTTGQIPDELRARRRDEAVDIRREIQDLADTFGKGAFPWSIAFEEVFQKELQGFDIVVANPPYVSGNNLLKASREGYKTTLLARFEDVSSGRADLLVYFYRRAFELLKDGGHIAFITSNKWLNARYGTKLRAFLGSEASFNHLIDFRDLPVFSGVNAYPLVSLASKRPSTDLGSVTLTSVPDLKTLYPDMHALTRAFGKEVSQSVLKNYSSWSIETLLRNAPGEKNRSDLITVEEYVGNNIFYGVKTGMNSVLVGPDGSLYIKGDKAPPGSVRTGVFVVDEATARSISPEGGAESKFLKPLLGGEDIKRWIPLPTRKTLIYTFKGMDPSEARQTLAYLSSYRSALERRATKQAWYELQQPQYRYRHAYDAAGIIYQTFQVKPVFAYKPEGVYINNAVWLLGLDDRYLLGVLNSKEFWKQIEANCTPIQNGRQLIWDQFKKCLVPKGDPESREKIKEYVDRILQAKTPLDDQTISNLEQNINRIVEFLYRGDAADRSFDEAMDAQRAEVKAMIRKAVRSPDGEGTTVELKRAFSGQERQNVLRAVAGFRNAEGGAVLLGVANDGTVVGLAESLAGTNTKDVDGLKLSLGQAIDSRISPAPHNDVDITTVDLPEGQVLRIEVKPSGLVKATTLGDKVPLRVRGQTKELQGQELLDHAEDRRRRYGANN